MSNGITIKTSEYPFAVDNEFEIDYFLLNHHSNANLQFVFYCNEITVSDRATLSVGSNKNDLQVFIVSEF